MTAQVEAAGIAALSICESLMITLVEKGVLTAQEARETLEDAAAAHPDSGVAGQIIEQLMVQVNAVSRNGDNRPDSG
ncbi:hypothetical protein [Azospirillum doebereinerae]|uniref:Uncharacterized protein n=1 Tax=Azospirillum doebereinerae TaxID=92933 RepID=A0A3S1CIU5_9PROT|nr:hypothetical protein [Azospirillum doebereinerae]MCG5238574.1 hypothetical protein [Azospirillum doebereinerae]RUQ74643.1 hypothetical protein EJ913_06305 [Azospirillum doebereinerae]